MDPEAVRKSLERTATAEKITGSTPARLHFYDPFVLSGVSIEAAEHGRLLCSFVVTPRLASPAGYLRSGVTATLADQLGSAVFFCSGLPRSGVSLEISVSFVDAASVGEEIEVEGKLLRAGKSVGVVSVDFRKKKTGKLMAQARHTNGLFGWLPSQPANSAFLSQSASPAITSQPVSSTFLSRPARQYFSLTASQPVQPAHVSRTGYKYLVASSKL